MRRQATVSKDLLREVNEIKKDLAKQKRTFAKISVREVVKSIREDRNSR